MCKLHNLCGGYFGFLCINLFFGLRKNKFVYKKTILVCFIDK